MTGSLSQIEIRFRRETEWHFEQAKGSVRRGGSEREVRVLGARILGFHHGPGVRHMVNQAGFAMGVAMSQLDRAPPEGRAGHRDDACGLLKQRTEGAHADGST